MTLTLFYDSQCPLCAQEMRALKARDANNQIQLEDIWQAEFSRRFPAIDPVAANQVLHALGSDGKLLLGLDVTAKAWSLVGVKRYNALRWPLIKPLADFCYRRFVNNRYSISRILTGQARLCPANSCSTTLGLKNNSSVNNSPVNNSQKGKQ